MTLDPDAINYFKDNTILEDPYTYFAALRERCPITREPHHDVMMCTGYDEATVIYNDVERFSSATSVTGPFPGFPVPLVGDDVSAIIEQYRDGLPFSDQLPTLDPPVHTEHRGLLMRMITPKRLQENEEFIWRLADRLLDAFIKDGECEFIDAFAQPFAMLVIADLLGVPEYEHANFREALLNHEQSALGGTGDETLHHSPLEYLYGRFSEFITERRANPTADVLTEMANMPFPSGAMPEVMDVVRVASNLFAAGQETTVRLISSALKVLGDDQALQAELRADRSLIPNFVEEALRLEAPVKGDFRLNRTAVDIAGVHIPAGTQVMVLNSAANRDPRKFENPDAFDPRRANARQHVAFGRGPHTCPGAPLARAESVVAFNRLFDRTKNIRISEKHHGPAGNRSYNYVPTFILRGLTHLHIEFDPADGEI
jgi:cytochrome P450